MEWEPKLRTRYVGLLMNVLEYRFRDDIPTKLAAFERTVHDYENQREPIHTDRRRRHQERCDHAGNGGHASERAPHPEQRQDHNLESDASGDSRDHANTTVHRQPTDANAARSEFAGQGQGQRKVKARTSRAKGRARKQRTKMRGSASTATSQATSLPGRLVAASPHPSDTAAVVPLQCLLPGERDTSTFVIAMPAKRHASLPVSKP